MEVSKVRSVDGVIFSQKRSETAHDDEKQYHTPQKPLQIAPSVPSSWGSHPGLDGFLVKKWQALQGLPMLVPVPQESERPQF